MTSSSGRSDPFREEAAAPSNAVYPDHPRLAVGAVVFNAGRVLLVRRGRPPGKGQWAIPGGSVQLGETLQQAAEREVLEETGVVIRARKPVYTFDLVERDPSGRVRFHYVIVDLAADYIQGNPRSGDDAIDARWVAAEDLPDLGIHAATRDLLRLVFQFG